MILSLRVKAPAFSGTPLYALSLQKQNQCQACCEIHFWLILDGYIEDSSFCPHAKGATFVAGCNPKLIFKIQK
jgi:hypothetical protein